ncbi:MAG: hypothetical protein P8Y29_02875 [Gemmatimonadota bacterium]|jgi:hypothetical protein
MRTLMLLLVIGMVASTLACDDENNSITGTFNLFIGETTDTCDGVLNDDIQSQIVISRDGDDFTVAFGDDGVLTGQLDNQGLIQVQGPVMVTIEVDGQPTEVDSFMEMQISIVREVLQATGRLTYDGTHPSSPGVQCIQEFGATGQRPSLVPLVSAGFVVDGS